MSLEKDTKIDLIQRSLGIKHKIKVHDSMKLPDSHEELSSMLNSKWELEDELAAIEEVLGEDRAENVKLKKIEILKGNFKPPKKKK